MLSYLYRIPNDLVEQFNEASPKFLPATMQLGEDASIIQVGEWTHIFYFTEKRKETIYIFLVNKRYFMAKKDYRWKKSYKNPASMERSGIV